jgi:hypothetical protein
VLFQRVQDIFSSYNRHKNRHHEFAFGGGLLRCGYDDCPKSRSNVPFTTTAPAGAENATCPISEKRISRSDLAEF